MLPEKKKNNFEKEKYNKDKILRTSSDKNTQYYLSGFLVLQ